MFYEFVSAIAGSVLIQGALFIVGDALGLLGEEGGSSRGGVASPQERPLKGCLS
jgi:hypothetical protein